MLRSGMRAGIALTMAMLLFCATSLVHAEGTYTAKDDSDVSAETILVDGFILRPVGVLATIVGSLAFVVTLPFSILTRSVDKAAQKLVVDPAKYTFVRPIGQIESHRPSTR